MVSSLADDGLESAVAIRPVGTEDTTQPLAPEGARGRLEATTGFEPVDGGFADLCLTTWLRRRNADSSILALGCQSCKAV